MLILADVAILFCVIRLARRKTQRLHAEAVVKRWLLPPSLRLLLLPLLSFLGSVLVLLLFICFFRSSFFEAFFWVNTKLQRQKG